jgi:methionyl-tRNA synthetase
MTTSFITTAIPFVNARPHVGFAYELVLADILARHRRRRGCDVRFSTGTDDNSLKNVLAAAREGVSTRELVDRNSAAFEALAAVVHAESDDFIATSRDPRHPPVVERLWRACAADLYRKTWEGRYCTGCEAFVDDYVTTCEEHDGALETIREDNWFFKLSRWRESIRELIASNRVRIVPDSARAETLGFLDGEVRDLSVSRIAERSGGWGLPVPDDPSQVIYVWFDALASYISQLDGDRFDRYWRGDERIHVIGKGITRFHAVYWLAFLLSAQLPLPDKIFVHGYLTVDGKKISKSGVSVEVDPFVGRCGIDAVRWFFARRCRTRVDSDVTTKAICDTYDRDLADRLGNLVQRCTSLAVKVCNRRVPERGDALRELAAALPDRIDRALDDFLVDDAAGAITDLLDAANRELERTAPWKLEPAAAARALYAPLEAARIAAAELLPFVPDAARTILHRLGDPATTPHWGGLEPGRELVTGPPPLPRKQYDAA